jgi:murein DD-endopeptidase MepM/ murein hydrolase activator NlpD
MSCCPSAPDVKTSTDAPPIEGPEQVLRPGETAECFSLRAGNSTGKLDDTVIAKNKIAVESVNSDCTAAIKLQFKLTDGSDATPITWTISGDAVPGTTFTNGLLSSGTGVIDPSVYDKKLTITIKASWPAAPDASTGDERTYTFSPGICKGGDSIKLLLPLQEAQFGDPYGMRFHPIHKVNKMHNGIDFRMATKGVHGDVYAAADGVCVKSKNTDPNGYGLSVWIKHNNSKGEHLCTTTYNHLYKSLVNEGDKVSAGQKIAVEGGLKGDPGSGGSTGLHVHFEVKLPNGAFTDPAPYFKGAVPLTATGGSAPQAQSGAAVTSADVAARTDCPAPPDYPADPNAPEPAAEAAPAGSSTDPFELAWKFTMRYEVGPHWAVPAGATPTDPEIVAGLCETASQKHKTGYKMWIGSSGGETKFGIAKSGNPKTDIKAIDYKGCKDLGYSNYWSRGNVVPKTIAAAGGTYLSIFLFDCNYQHGPGGGATIWHDSAPGASWTDKASQMPALDRLWQRRVQFASTLKNVADRAGCVNRANDSYAYVKGLNL